MIIFKAKTHCAHIIKVLIELLQRNISTGSLEIDENGIRLSSANHPLSYMIDFELESENFTFYKFKLKKKKFVGVNFSHFHKMLKSIKKKDSMQLYIDDEEPNKLFIQVIPKENNRKTTSHIIIQPLQQLKLDLPTGYGKPILVPSAEFQKMIKDMANMEGKTIQVYARNFHIRFSCTADEIMSRKVEFGELGESDEDDDDDDEVEEYCKDFDIDQLSKITKISGLSSNIQVYPKNGKPLFFKSAVGQLGKVRIYIFSKDLIEKMKNEIDVMNSDDEM